MLVEGLARVRRDPPRPGQRCSSGLRADDRDAASPHQARELLPFRIHSLPCPHQGNCVKTLFYQTRVTTPPFPRKGERVQGGGEPVPGTEAADAGRVGAKLVEERLDGVDLLCVITTTDLVRRF